MNIMDLKQEIYNLPDDMEVRIAHQPQWAFEYSVGDVVVTNPGDQYYIVHATELMTEGEVYEEPGWYVTVDGREDPEPVAGPLEDEAACHQWIAEKIGDEKPMLYLGEGHQIGYLPDEARRALSW
jgi:hypothetical protein